VFYSFHLSSCPCFAFVGVPIRAFFRSCQVLSPATAAQALMSKEQMIGTHASVVVDNSNDGVEDAV
jgi:hypothetical protein